MNRFASIVFCLSMSTAAVAGDRELAGTSGDRDTDTSDETSSIWPPPSKFPFPLSSTGPYDPTSGSDDGLGPGAIQIEYMGSGRDVRRGSHEYDFDVDGELFTVEVQNGSTRSSLALYDEMGDVVVGYVTSDRGAYIFDGKGIVERGRAGEIDISTIQDYGVTASLLANPVFLSSIIEANGDVFEGDDDPPAYWWIPAAYLIARCAEINVTYDSDGNWSVSAGWDC